MNTDQLFQLFFPRYPLPGREWMLQANKQDGYVYATDGFAFVRIAVENCPKQYVVNANMKSFRPIFDELTAHDPIPVTRSQLIKALVNFDLVSIEKDCDYCDGVGCAHCNYTALMPDKQAPLVFPSTSAAIKFGNVYFSPFYLNKLVGVMTLTEECGCFYSCGQESNMRAQLFKVGECEVVIMPLLPDMKELKKYKVIDFYTGEQIIYNVNPKILV